MSGPVHRCTVTVPADRAVARATVIAPAGPADTVVFCYPGGGYGRGYFDLHPNGAAGYSQAEHHAAEGCVVVAVDHAVPVDAAPLDLATVGTATPLPPRHCCTGCAPARCPGSL